MVDIYNQFKDFKSFEVAFQSKDGQLQKIFCNVKSIENNSIVLDANNAKNNNIFAEVGDELKLHIYTENGIYSAASKILLSTRGIINTEYVIAYPANSKHSQRREYFRADLDVPFRLKIVKNAETGEKFFIEGKTRNICGKGMSFVYSADLEEYSSIELTLNFKDKVIMTQATLVYSKQIIAGSKPQFIHAITFNNISAKDIDFIVKKCFLHQLELRKKLV